MIKLWVSATVLLSLSGAICEARVTRESQEIYLEAAKAAGGCKDKDFLKKLELQYSACQATDEQFKELFKAFDTAKADDCKPETLGNVQTMWMLSATFGRELRMAGASASNC